MIDIVSLASSSKGNCYKVSDGNTSILLECGISFKEINKKLNFKTHELAACFITHLHKDHCKAIKEVLKSAIDCYMSIETAQALGVVGHHRVKIVKSKEQFTVGTWVIMPFDVAHDCEGTLGFLMVSGGYKVLFLTDTYKCDYLFSGLTHIMVECNHSLAILKENVDNGTLSLSRRDRLLRSHFALENVLKFLAENDLSKVFEIWLLHLSDQNSNEALFKEEIERAFGKPVIVAPE